MLTKSIFYCSLIITHLSGCALPTIRQAETEWAKNKKEAEIEIAAGRQRMTDAAKVPSVTQMDYWIPVRPVAEVARAEPTPLDGKSVTLQGQYASLEEVAERLTQRLGVPVRVARDTAQLPAVRQGITIDHAGELSVALDKIASRYGISWRYDAGAIHFYLLDTRVFYLNTAPGDSTLSTTLSGAGAGSNSAAGSGNTATQTLSFNAQLSQWQAVEQAIRATLLSNLGRVTVSPATGAIVVTDTPDILERVERYMDMQNKRLDAHVMFDIRIYSLSRTKTDDYGIDWNAFYTALSGQYVLKVLSPYGSDASGSAFTLGVPHDATGNAAKYADTQAIVRALSTQGDVSNVANTTLFTSSNNSVQYGRTRQIGYLARSGTVQTANVGSQASLEPGSVKVGFSVNLTPTIQPDGRINVVASLNLSSLARLRRITSQDSAIEVPEIEDNQSGQRIPMRSGEPLVMMAYDQWNSTGDLQGVGVPQNFLLGGGARGEVKRDTLVVLVTPYVTR